MESFSALAKSTPNSIHLWHRRLGHVAVSTIKKMADDFMADGLILSEDLRKDLVCEGCMYGKPVSPFQPLAEPEERKLAI
jgi:hypothetical protein